MHIIYIAVAFAVAQPAPFDGDALVTEAITQTRAMAFRTRDVDWTALEARVRQAAAGAKDEIDLLPAYELLVEGLGDGHSFVNVSADMRAAFKARHGREFDSGRRYKKQTGTLFMRGYPLAQQLPLGRGKAATQLIVPKLFGAGAAGRASFTARLFGNIKAAAPVSCGYVVDLRGNSGGNVWPMLAGLSPLLGNMPIGREIDREGIRSDYARLEDGAAIVNEGEDKDARLAAVADWQPLPALQSAPVAVLIDDFTASSGEGVAVAFKGRPHTRFFGQKSYGVASSNQGFVVGEQANVVITTAMMADRNGRIYPDGIAPDVPVAAGAGSPTDPDDAVVEAAKAWMSRQPACRG